MCLKSALILNLLDNVGGGLVNEIVKPVCKEKSCVTAPGGEGLFRIIVTGEIVLGNLWIDAKIFIARVLLVESIGVVLGVTREEDLSSLSSGDGIHACLLG